MAMTKAWHFTFDALWPKDVAGLHGPALEDWTMTTRGRGVNDPFVLFTQLSCAARLCALLCVDKGEKKRLLDEEQKCRKVAFRLVSKAINARIQDTAVVDTLIHAILLLGTTEAAYIFTPRTRVFKTRSPMMDAFIYELYGHFAPSNTTNAHHQAVLTLVKERGGIEALDPTVGMTVQVTDVAIATWNNIRPFFPLRQATENLLLLHTPVLDSLAIRLSSTLGTGFQILSSSDTDPALLATISEACRLTILIEQHARHGAGSLNIQQLSLAAIGFQHGLCSLVPLPASDLRVAARAQCLGEAIRVAMCIYSTRVFYPPIRPYDMEVRAAKELKVCMQDLYAIEATESGLTGENNKSLPLIKWLLVLGATAAEEGEDTSYFTRELHERLAGTSGTKSSADLEAVKETVGVFLWWDYIFDAPLRETLKQVSDLDGK